MPYDDVPARLEQLRTRVPGRVTVPVTRETQVLIACQLVKINSDAVIVQLGLSSYEIPISSIVDIRDVQNPIELERSSGVDVVITVKSNQTPVQTRVNHMFPRREVPLPLLNAPRDWMISENDYKVLQARTDRWTRLNNLLLDTAPPTPTLEAPEGGDVESPDGGVPDGGGGTSEDVCTIRKVCVTSTMPPILGPIVCDEYDNKQCRSW